MITKFMKWRNENRQGALGKGGRRATEDLSAQYSRAAEYED
jgi:hypothetical protein